LTSEITDQLHQNAMAPVRNPEPLTPAASQAPAPGLGTATLVVQSKAKNADLHSGPGSLYPTVAYAEPTQRLLVADWNDRWFKVVLPGEEHNTAAKTGWIRTDLVQVLPAKAGEKLSDYP
jgi:hypothetical protein